MQEPTKEQFLSDVKDHAITILKDDGVYRHINYAKPGTINMSFQITTWPGYLCISGDMGCYTFSRTNDMFNFFGGDDLGINPSYWQEKVQAGASYSGASAICKEYSPEKFKSAVKECANDWLEQHPFDDEEKKESFEEEIEEITDCADDYYDAINAVRNSNLRCLQDFFENSIEAYKYHYIWCLWAIVWGISVYEKEKAKAAE